MKPKVYNCYINGEWIKKTSGENIDVENPANGNIFASIFTSTTDEVQHALESAEKAQFSWQMLPPVERAKYLYAITDKLKEEKEHFAKLLVMEQGKTLVEARYEVDDTIR